MKAKELKKDQQFKTQSGVKYVFEACENGEVYCIAPNGEIVGIDENAEVAVIESDPRAEYKDTKSEVERKLFKTMSNWQPGMRSV